MIVQTPTAAAPRRRPAGGNAVAPRRLWREIKKHRWHYVFVTPMLVLFLAFTVWPTVASWVYAFFDWDGFGPPADLIGLDNFREVLASSDFWNAFTHSVQFAFVGILVQVPLALVLAVMLNNRRLRGRTFYRLLLFLPVVSTMAVLAIMWKLLLNPANGVVNEALGLLGLDPVNFLGDPSTALVTLFAISIWKDLGITLVYWMAALQTVPREVYEAAALDGARPPTVLTRITIPLIIPFALVIMLLTFRQSMNVFDVVQPMTGGGPGQSTAIIPTYLYDTAFSPTPPAVARYGFASAVGVVYGVAVLLFSLLVLPLMRRYGAARAARGVAR